MAQAEVGIIGGTGLGAILEKEGGETVSVDTPYGPPSSPPMLAEWEGVKVAFLSRHGLGHRFNPSNVPYRANIWALKQLGVRSILASGATGSLREEIEPGHLVLCDQVIDKTFRRAGTFFDEGLVAHVELAEPFSQALRGVVLEAGRALDTVVHDGGSYVCMEGPQFSTCAESLMHRQWGGSVIGMTCMPEAKLAREAEISYALIALATDYDCWRPHESTGGATVLQEVIANLNRATDAAIQLIRATLPLLAKQDIDDPCREALKLALWTDLSRLDAAVIEIYRPLIAKYLPS